MLALNSTLEDPQSGIDCALENVLEIHLIESAEHDIYVFYRNNLFAQYQKRDHYSRNLIIAQLFLCHRVAQKILSEVFQLTIPHISRMIADYRRKGSVGIEDHTEVRIGNNQKIKGKVSVEIIKQLDVPKEDRPTYERVAQQIKRKHRIDISAHRIGCWWREHVKEKQELQKTAKVAEQSELPIEEKPAQQHKEHELDDDITLPTDEDGSRDNTEEMTKVGSEWQANHIAGSFILYAMLNESQFLKPFIRNLKKIITNGRNRVERVMLTLFFMHALRLKSIEQSKHLLAAHFGPIVLGPFCRVQSLRYAIDDITQQKHFDKAITEHYQNICQRTELGDDIYYTDGHFSCYYGKYAIPKGYDPRRQQAQRGRNTVYLHNSLGHNLLSFESPTNTTLSVDIETLLEKMKTSFGDIKGKHLFFDRGGYSADCFKQIKKAGMTFTTYLKYRKKRAEIEEEKFEETEINIHGKVIKNRIYETEKQSKKYGMLRTLIFIGKQGKQIPVISTAPSKFSAAEIVARLQKRWVEENGFKYMGEHFNVDLLTTYKTEQAPDKIMERRNPKRKEINQQIATKKAKLRELKETYSNRLRAIKDKAEISVSQFEEQEEKLDLAIKNAELDIGLLQLERKKIPSKIKSNLKDESVITRQKRRMFINVIKTMNYNCEKWLQLLFCQYHSKVDETLSLIRHVLIQPGRIRQRGQVLEVELERLDNAAQANSLDKVLEKIKQDNHLELPDGRKLAIWQAR